MSQGAYKITEEFEACLAEYTGAPYVVAVNSCTMALFLAMKWHRVEGRTISIPQHTYMSVPCYIHHAGARVLFLRSPEHLTGPYKLRPFPIWDCALRFTRGMYAAGQTQCLSFSGPRKHLKLGKGGAILTDSAQAARWYRQARYVGRHEVPYHEDQFDMIGWDCYMQPETAARGLLLMSAMPAENPDLCLPYPDLSRFGCYTSGNIFPLYPEDEP